MLLTFKRHSNDSPTTKTGFLFNAYCCCSSTSVDTPTFKHNQSAHVTPIAADPPTSVDTPTSTHFTCEVNHTLGCTYTCFSMQLRHCKMYVLFTEDSAVASLLNELHLKLSCTLANSAECIQMSSYNFATLHFSHVMIQANK